MKEWICAAAGTVGGLIAGLFGGWDAAMLSLLIFMGIDYITGVIVAASGKSLKSDNGGLSSKIGWRGLAKSVSSCCWYWLPHGWTSCLVRIMCVLGSALDLCAMR